MLKEKANGFYKKGTFTNELVWGNYSFIISTQPKKKQESFRKGMFLYGMVRRDHGWSVIQLGELININFVLNSQGLGVVEQGLGVVFWAK